MDTYIRFDEKMTPEYIAYIDSCKERAQQDSEYWSTLHEMLSHGELLYEVISEASEAEELPNSESNETESEEDTDLTTIKSLLEYQTKMLENMNFAYDTLISKCDTLIRYCAKLSRRLRNREGNDSKLELTQIINNKDEYQVENNTDLMDEQTQTIDL